jgi:hypothetical protein
MLLLNTNAGLRQQFQNCCASRSEAAPMPWFDKLAIEPARIRAMQAAYYKACAQLGLSPASDPITEILVTKIIDLGAAGECDPHRLCEIVVSDFRAHPTLFVPEKI